MVCPAPYPEVPLLFRGAPPILLEVVMLPNPESAPRVSRSATQVADVRAVPLDALSEHADQALRRIVPPAETLKAPVATFDASL